MTKNIRVLLTEDEALAAEELLGKTWVEWVESRDILPGTAFVIPPPIHNIVLAYTRIKNARLSNYIQAEEVLPD
jgi:hypothetical protein